MLVGVLGFGAWASVGCVDADDTDNDVLEPSAAVAAREITGSWEVRSVHGTSSHASGSSVQRIESFAAFGPGKGAVVSLRIASQGSGSITSSKSCLAEPLTLVKPQMPEGASGPGEGALAVVYAAINVLRIVDYMSSARLCEESGSTASSAQTFSTHIKEFPKNIGIAEMPVSSTAANGQCRALRGSRMFRTGSAGAETFGCIGYGDGSGSTLVMLVQRPGDVRLSKVTLARTHRAAGEPSNVSPVAPPDACNLSRLKEYLPEVASCIRNGGGATCLNDASGRYRSWATFTPVAVCGSASGGAYTCDHQKIADCIKNGGGQSCVTQAVTRKTCEPRY